MRHLISALVRDERGQDLVEYALIVAAVGLALITTVNTLSDAIVSLWKDGPLDRIELQALSEAEVVELVQAALGGHVDGSTLHRLWRASQGNPLYLRELALALASGHDGQLEFHAHRVPPASEDSSPLQVHGYLVPHFWAHGQGD